MGKIEHIICCGILKKEIQYLMKKNSWDISLTCLDSSLHVNFNKLEKALKKSLKKTKNKENGVFYGVCHPNIDNWMRQYKSKRTPVQNCIEILLGKKLFTDHLSHGAFFLLEEWAQRWNEITQLSFGEKPEIIREIFHSAHKYFLCIRTPCSGNFSQEANDIGHTIGLPIHWIDVDLKHLESVFKKTFHL